MTLIQIEIPSDWRKSVQHGSCGKPATNELQGEKEGDKIEVIKDTTLKSLQSLSGSDNLSLISDLLRTKSERRRQKLMGLRAILEDLLAPKDGGGLPSGIMSFER